jgi:hypothetical protein
MNFVHFGFEWWAVEPDSSNTLPNLPTPKPRRQDTGKTEKNTEIIERDPLGLLAAVNV